MNETEILNDVYDSSSNSLASTGAAGGTAIDGGTVTEIFNAVYDPASNALRISAGSAGQTAEWGQITGDITQQADLQDALDDKVDKVVTASQVYIVNSNGEQSSVGFSFDTFNAFTVVMRNGSGQIYVNTATNGSQAVNLNQLNARLSQAQRTAIDALDTSTSTVADIINALQA